MKLTKIIETSIYSHNLHELKNFYINVLGLELVSEEKERHVFLKVGKNMLLIFNPDNTLNNTSIFPSHGVFSPPSIIHFAFEIKREDYEEWKCILEENDIKIEKELNIGNNRSIYFRDPVGNLVELITNNAWPVDD
ncbi:MAG: glyoxalase/bleomycin resistance/extradiol dioxygenase family protein [Nitrososphaeraceae archaeon]|nr:glyoxalase/bleomycin resistance/extradiol dioxygenase family protein [Nitrososphaeraceae archaeon]